ncbi:hypothetical protein LGM58_20535 [Burkholderia contaminans]|uniref:hypothetical protein n=1 Tax=Burkholderia contaminans TaxID=488447 RepID=UPI001CF3B01A|nr:hypothetical protein [Burkholderia contaminans]MCA7885574.1 hypothetical protein [Burkholderia contaminans]
MKKSQFSSDFSDSWVCDIENFLPPIDPWEYFLVQRCEATGGTEVRRRPAFRMISAGDTYGGREWVSGLPDKVGEMMGVTSYRNLAAVANNKAGSGPALWGQGESSNALADIIALIFRCSALLSFLCGGSGQVELSDVFGAWIARSPR